MNYGFKMECPSCGSTEVAGAGGSFGGRVEFGKRVCKECGLVVLISPIKTGYSYTISAKTEDEIEQEENNRSRIIQLHSEIEQKFKELLRIKDEL